MCFGYEAMERSVKPYPHGSIKRLADGENIEPFSTKFVGEMKEGIASRDRIQVGLDREQKAKDKANNKKK